MHKHLQVLLCICVFDISEWSVHCALQLLLLLFFIIGLFWVIHWSWCSQFICILVQNTLSSLQCILGSNPMWLHSNVYRCVRRLHRCARYITTYWSSSVSWNKRNWVWNFLKSIWSSCFVSGQISHFHHIWFSLIAIDENLSFDL